MLVYDCDVKSTNTDIQHIYNNIYSRMTCKAAINTID